MEDNWGTYMQLLQKAQELTDAPEGNTMHQVSGGEPFWILRNMCLLLLLKQNKINVHIFILFKSLHPWLLISDGNNGVINKRRY